MKCPEGVQRGFLSERKGKVIPCRGAKDRKGSRTNSGKSGITRNLEAEGIRSRIESTRECVKLKTVTEIRQSCVCNTFIVECLSCTEVFVGLGVGFLFLFFQYEVSSTVLAPQCLGISPSKIKQEHH